MASYLACRYFGLGKLATVVAPLAAATLANASVVVGNYVVTNSSDFTQTFTFETNVFVPSLAASTITGSVTGTVTDLNGDGATVTSGLQGGFIYSGLIDGVAARQLMGPIFDFSAGQFLSSTGGPQSFVNEAGPGVVATIGIRLVFTLTAHDSASFTSIFTVNAVPAPGSLGLVGLAGVLGLRRRRR